MGTYRVVRQDDNGNRFLVAKDLDGAGAQRLAAELEARGHKQLYWVEEVEAPGAPGAPGAAGAADADRTGNGAIRNA
ncbi:SPOR domain-containing protein [Kitasatospora sp. NPDC059577]|uniref:SPOR domain-containing protein n=1 Tax=unclassified Kitasatospora TaxID=2633591 RepID=UPI0036AA7057